MKTGAISTAAAVLLGAAILVLGGCGGEQKGPVARIYLGLPLTGTSGQRSKDMQRAVQLALKQSGYAEGGRTLELRTVNTGARDEGTKAASKAVNDESSLALIAGGTYLGTLRADDTSRNGGLLQVAPLGGSGLDASRYGEPVPRGVSGAGNGRPPLSELKNLIFVAPSDYVLGEAVVQQAAGDDRVEWSAGISKSVIAGMRAAGARAGIAVSESTAGICPESNSTKVFGLEKMGGNRAFAAVACDKEVLVVDDSQAAADLPGAFGRRLVTPALAYDDLPPAGRRFYDNFKAEYGRYPDRWAIFAFEAAGLTLQAIKDAAQNGGEVTRDTVREAAFKIKDRFGPVGHYDVPLSGQTTLFTVAARKLPLPTDSTTRRAPGDDQVIEVTR